MPVDDFDRANETPIGAPWQSVNSSWLDVNLTGNAVRAAVNDNNCLARYNGSLGGNHYSEAACVEVASAARQYHVDTRIQGVTSGTVDCYSLWQGVPGIGTRVVLYRIDDTVGLVFTQLGADLESAANAAGDRIKLSSIESDHYVYRNGVLLGSRSDSTYTGGQPGLGPYENLATATMDNWEGGDVEPDPEIGPQRSSRLAQQQSMATG